MSEFEIINTKAQRKRLGWRALSDEERAGLFAENLERVAVDEEVAMSEFEILATMVKRSPEDTTLVIRAAVEVIQQQQGLIQRLVIAMEQWGSWEDGVPDPSCYGPHRDTIGVAYDHAKAAIASWDAIAK